MSESTKEESSGKQVESLRELANDVLASYPIAVRSLELVHHGFNTTFKVVAENDSSYALRINVNSRRTPANVAAEVAWVGFLNESSAVSVARPVALTNGAYSQRVNGDKLGRETSAVMFEWLPGSIVAQLDDPAEALRHSGHLLAQLHLEGARYTLPAGAELPIFDSVFWGYDNALTGNSGVLDTNDQALFGAAIEKVQALIASYFASGQAQIIHADVHAGNMMWHDGQLSVFDFDDCGIGFPIQDIAISLSYLPDPAYRSLVLEAYEEIAPLPTHTPEELLTLVLHRRLQLLNYFAGSKNAEHRAIFENFLVGARKQVENFLAN